VCTCHLCSRALSSFNATVLGSKGKGEGEDETKDEETKGEEKDEKDEEDKEDKEGAQEE